MNINARQKLYDLLSSIKTNIVQTICKTSIEKLNYHIAKNVRDGPNFHNNIMWADINKTKKTMEYCRKHLSKATYSAYVTTSNR